MQVAAPSIGLIFGKPGLVRNLHWLLTMSVVSRGVPQSIDSLAMDEDASEAHIHALEVLHQWQELQGAVREIAASKHADEG